MRNCQYITEYGGRFEIAGISLENFDSPDKTDLSVAPRNQDQREGKNTTKGDSSMSEEQKEKLERMMENVKAFIRDIDINAL